MHTFICTQKTCKYTHNYYEMFGIMGFSFKSPAYLLSSTFTSSSLPLLLLFFLLFPSKQFQTFPLPSSPSRVNPVASVPHFSPPSFSSPFLSSLWFSYVHSRLIHVHSLWAGPPLNAPALCRAVNHLSSSNQQKAACASQVILANMSSGGGKCVEKKKSGSERVCLPCMCVFWNKANTLCAIFEPHCRVAKDSIFWKNRVYFKASKIAFCSIRSVLIEEIWNWEIRHGIIMVCKSILMKVSLHELVDVVATVAGFFYELKVCSTF